MSLRINFAVVGDSAAYGTGDFDEAGAPRGWGWHLARAFRDECNYANFSRPGAQSTEVLDVQLPKALAEDPDICAVIVGGNDMLRNGFDPDLLLANLRTTVSQLLSRGSEVLMIELHDPNQLLRLPRLLKRVLRRRVDAVNACYRKIASEFDVVLIRTRDLPDVHAIHNWHIDRMHPGPNGHQLLAREMAEQLRRRGWAISLPVYTPYVREKSAAQIKWLIVKGAPWFLKRSVDLLPAALILMAIELVRVCVEKVSEALSPAGVTAE